jgi:hypothetical protein
MKTDIICIAIICLVQASYNHGSKCGIQKTKGQPFFRDMSTVISLTFISIVHSYYLCNKTDY